MPTTIFSGNHPLSHCFLELIPSIRGLRLDGFHIDVDDLSILCGRSEVNYLGSDGQESLIFQTGELQARICKEGTRYAHLIVSFVHRSEITPAVLQYRHYRRVEAVQQHLAFFE